jgi:hypothetical protein
MSNDEQRITAGDDVFGLAPEFLRALAAMMPDIGLRTGYIPLGDPDDPATPGVVMLYMGPGVVLDRHAHTCERFEVVVKGSLYVGDKVLLPGDVMRAAPYEFYGPHTAGPEGVLTAEVFSSFAAAYTPVYELPDGTKRVFDWVAGDVPTEEAREFASRNAPVVALN